MSVMTFIVTISLASAAAAAFKGPALGEIARAIAVAIIHYQRNKTIRYALKRNDDPNKDS